MIYSVKRNGIELEEGEHYTFDGKYFSSHYANLDIDFSGRDYINFNVYNHIKIKCGNNCELNIWCSCKIKAGKGSKFYRNITKEKGELPENKWIKFNGFEIPGYLNEEELMLKEIIE